MRRVLLAVVSAITFSVAGGTVAFAQSDPGTIVDIASGNPDFSTLVTAVTKAELAETLSGEGPFTVFAPTNKAFEALPAGTLDTLLADPKGALADILKLHVMSGAVDSKAAIAAAGGNVDTLGGPVSVELDGDKLVVGGATVVTADLKASNGIIHVIDAVITKSAAPAAASEAPEASEEPAEEAAEDATVPARVDAGDDGLAASSQSNALLVALAAVGMVGLGGSTVALARSRRRK